MQCVRCGEVNDPSSRFCSRCQAKLLQKPAETASSVLEIEEGRAYLAPPDSYDTAHVRDLFVALEAALEGEGDFEVVAALLAGHEERLEEFEGRAAPDMLSLLQQEKARIPDDDFHAQVAYLLARGTGLYREGCEQLRQALESGQELSMLEACEKIGIGNDHLCYSFELVHGRMEALEEIVKRHPD